MACRPGDDVRPWDDVRAAMFQRLKDRVLIVVGRGVAVERLATRRLEAGGRLCVVETDNLQNISTEELPLRESAPDLWAPPRPTDGNGCSLAARFRASPEKDWIKKGPDVVKLAEGESLRILAAHGGGVGVRVTQGEAVVWEMSGFVVRDPSLSQAESMDVAVQDPEAMPLFHLSKMNVALCFLMYLPLVTGMLLLTTYAERAALPGQLPWWRGLAWAPIGFLGFSTQTAPAYAIAFSGVVPSLPYCLITGGVGAMVSFLIALLGTSAFLVVTGGVVPAVYFAQGVYMQSRKSAPPTRSWKAHYIFGSVFVNLSLGVCYAYFGVAVGYLSMLAWNVPVLPILFLPSMTSAIESGSVMVTAAAYHSLVTKKREKVPGSVQGDHRWSLTIAIGLSHGWAEATRMASLLASTVAQNDGFSWIATLALCLVSNILSRTGWSIWALSFVMWRAGMPSLGNSLRALHVDVKITCGYPRFAIPLGLGLARLIIYRELDPSAPGFILFNMTTLLAALSCFVFELLEDLIVMSRLVPRPSFMPWHAPAYVGLSRYQLGQLVTLTETPGVQGGVAIAYAGTKPCCALNLHGTRPVSLRNTLAIVFFVGNVGFFVLELLLGAGYVRGLCQQPLSDMSEAVTQAFSLPTPFPCG